MKHWLCRIQVTKAGQISVDYNNSSTNLQIHQVKILSNKMALASWLLLLKTAEIHTSYFLKIFRCLTGQKQKSPHCYANLRGTLNRYEHLIKVRLHYNVLT